MRLFALAGAVAPDLAVRPLCGVDVAKGAAPRPRRMAARRHGTAPSARWTRSDLAPSGERAAKAPAGGIAFSGTGQVSEPRRCATRCIAAFAGAAGARGQRQRHRITATATRGDCAAATGAAVQCRGALIAAGAWSRPLMRQLGVDVAVDRRTRLFAAVGRPSWPGELPPVVFEERALVVTRFTCGLRASSFVEFGAPDAPADPRKWARHRSICANSASPSRPRPTAGPVRGPRFPITCRRSAGSKRIRACSMPSAISISG